MVFVRANEESEKGMRHTAEEKEAMAATIGDILKRAGLVRPKLRRRVPPKQFALVRQSSLKADFKVGTGVGAE